MRLAICCVLVLMLSSCWNFRKPGIDVNLPYDYTKVWGWKAIYGADTLYKKIFYTDTAQQVKNAGKIYVYGAYIFQSETGKGIHLIDNHTPKLAKRIGFISIGGNTDMAMQGNYLYANNYNDMVILDVTDIKKIKEINRFKGTFNTANTMRPYPWQAPPDTGWFSCPNYYIDSIVIGWQRDSVYKHCRRN